MLLSFSLPDTNPSTAQVTFVKVIDAPGGEEDDKGGAAVSDQITSSSSSPPLEGAPGPPHAATEDAVAGEILEGGLGGQEIQDEFGQEEEEEGEYVRQDVVTLDLTAGGTGEAISGKYPKKRNEF